MPIWLTGAPWVRWPPWLKSIASTVSPGSRKAKYAAWFIGEPDSGCTLACSARNKAQARSRASVSTRSVNSWPP
ncbi:MAG: hypothetical protein WDN03_06895 [Rhizomicrobium sp.]